MIWFCKQLCSIPPYTFTGDYEQNTITVNGSPYLLITLLSDGIFIPTGIAMADIWLCGGGAGGVYPSARSGGNGGGGGFPLSQMGWLPTVGMSYAVSIGQGGNPAPYPNTNDANRGGTTIFGNFYAQGGYDRNGGSGGGAGVTLAPTNAPSPDVVGVGTTQGTRPFWDAANFHPLCAGGGGGIDENIITGWSCGGDGGSNGGAGKGNYYYGIPGVRIGGKGGWRGGGAGAGYPESANAYDYGGGGGGRSATESGKGYRGVVYIRTPII